MNIFRKSESDSSEQIEQLENQVSELGNEVADLQEQVKTLTEEKATLESLANEASENLKTKEQEVTELQAKVEQLEKSQTEFDEKVSLGVQELAAKLGFDGPLDLDEIDENSAPSVVEKFKSLSGKAAVEFYETHKAEILQSLNNNNNQ